MMITQWFKLVWGANWIILCVGRNIHTFVAPKVRNDSCYSNINYWIILKMWTYSVSWRQITFPSVQMIPMLVDTKSYVAWEQNVLVFRVRTTSLLHLLFEFMSVIKMIFYWPLDAYLFFRDTGRLLGQKNFFLNQCSKLMWELIQ